MVGRALAAGLALFGALSPPAAAQDGKAAVRALERAWRTDVTAERLATLESLALHDEPVCVDKLIELVERDETAMLPTVRRILGGYSAPASIEALMSRGLRHRTPAVRAQVILALGEARSGALDWAALVEDALDDPFPVVRAAAVRTVGRARLGGRLDRVVELAGDPAERVRVEVPAALARLAGSRSLGALDRLATDPRWRVRLGAMQAYADVKTRPAVERLVEALARETGRLREDGQALLERLTGRFFGADAALWARWLAQAPEDFLAAGDDLALARLAPPRYADGTVRYYSISTASTRFVLLTDLSGSMETPVRMLGDRLAAPAPRLDLARAELTRLIGSLPSSSAFDLVSFRDEASAWRPALVRADERTRRAALAELEGWRPWGGTDIHGALKTVFDMAERALDSDRPRDEDLDTLFLLSDGAPSAGAVRDIELLLQFVAERNRVLRLRIHCLSFTGLAECRDFLARLAALGGGQYVELVAAE